MIRRILTLLVALGALVGVVAGARVVLVRTHPVVTAARPAHTFPRKYVGIVSYNVTNFDQRCACVS